MEVNITKVESKIPLAIRDRLDALFMKDVELGEESPISSRSIYRFMGLDNSHYSRWCKKSIVNNSFVEEGVDWCVLATNGENYVTGRKSKEYALTPDFCRRLAMGVSDNEMANYARIYFSERHEKLKAIEQSKNQVGSPNYFKRYHVNSDKIDDGYFSVIGEMTILVHGVFERNGLVLPDKTMNGTEIRPDSSVGITFANYLKKEYPDKKHMFKKYSHYFPELGITVRAKQYDERLILIFRNFVKKIWLTKYAPSYLGDRYPKALPYLDKLLKAA